MSEGQSANKRADEARKSGDWAGYGQAQKDLQSALEKAVAAREELNKAG